MSLSSAELSSMLAKVGDRLTSANLNSAAVRDLAHLALACVVEVQRLEGRILSMEMARERAGNPVTLAERVEANKRDADAAMDLMHKLPGIRASGF